MTALLISDIHLSERRPDLTEAFQQFLSHRATKATELFILGDLFEVWLGDDDQTPLNKSIISSIRELADSGVSVFVMHGNRDFMIGKRFERESGAKLIDDPTVIELYGHELILSHGDSYCTDDITYQKTKKKIRNPIVLPILRNLPLSTRQKIAGNLRNKSAEDKQMVSADIMDVNAEAISDAFAKYDVKIMIHGHTHRPCHHTDNSVDRYVLGDWDTTLWYIEVNDDGIQLIESDI